MANNINIKNREKETSIALQNKCCREGNCDTKTRDKQITGCNFVFCHESRSSTLSTWSPVTELPTPLSFLLHNDLGGGINLEGKGYIRRQPGDIRGGEHSP